MGLKQIPEIDRPRERLYQLGADSLSIAELIAIVLGSGTKGISALQLGQAVLSRFGTLEKLSQATLEELQQIKGFGFAKAVQLKAALSLGVRVASKECSVRHQVFSPQHAYSLIKEQLQREKRELFLAILLDIKGFVIGKPVIAVGTLSNTLVHPREVFYPAIRHKASSLLLAHNHPSGDPTPSQEDIEVTRSLIEVGELMGIPIQDHLIVGDRGYVSLREVGVFNL